MDDLLYSRVEQTLKLKQLDFTENLKLITDNVNFIFNASYTEKDVGLVIGAIYEKQFYYTDDLRH